MPRKVIPIAEEADQGKPGEFYFNEPLVREIKSLKPSSSVENIKPTPSSHVTYGQGVCRLRSSHEILGGYTPPKNLEYHLSRWPSRIDADAYIEMMSLNGYGQGAIVTRKHQPFEMMTKVHRWGVILIIHKHLQSSEWTPYMVKWFGDGTVESAWAEDLYVMHAAMDERLIHDILESQGCDLPMNIIQEASPV